MPKDNVDFVVVSKIVGDTFHSNRPDFSDFGHIILGCRKLFHSNFINSRVEEFNKLQTNAVAHALTREALL